MLLYVAQHQFPLTLKCLSYFSLPFVHKGVHLDPTIFKYFSMIGIFRLFRENSHVTKILKTTFPKEFFSIKFDSK